jgi:catechol 2,3-dioxygenase-like lactoylglutathione lyase family enzyme
VQTVVIKLPIFVIEGGNHMQEYQFHHIHVFSTDPVKAADFYEKTFGAKKGPIGKLADGRIRIDVTITGVPIRITPPRAKPLLPGSPASLEHFGLITNDLDAAVSDLKAKGLKFVQEPTATQRSSFFLTPENVLVELMEASS